MDASSVSTAAGVLHTVLTELPPTTPGETAIARRIEGAALALDAWVRQTKAAPRSEDQERRSA